ncbi:MULTISPECIES: hypothetical protein [Terrisporobacter]|uniref:hypothetical protein n=1 Tax=Terrisporobacter TaxID=1505652 RepID=UPI00094387FE|nr:MULTISPECIES: hypothetical protein [Terrisporobacter]MCC3671566.1 hypothetical protein [Terrisporobacter mayombei]MDU6986503.1 hypothetical protein [Terrisporobacter othiniensis]
MKRENNIDRLFILGIIIIICSMPLGYLIGWEILGQGHSIELSTLLFEYTCKSIQLVGIGVIGLSYFNIKNKN